MASKNNKIKREIERQKKSYEEDRRGVGCLPTTLDPPEPSVMDDQLGRGAVSEVGLQRSDRIERFLGR